MRCSVEYCDVTIQKDDNFKQRDPSSKKCLGVPTVGTNRT